AEDASLVKLIDTLCALPDPFWLRVMYMQPEGIDEELLECFARNHQMCHYFEIPMQHASARILRAMQRAGDGEHFLGLLDRIRSRFPDAVVRTTLIAGYPGETDEEFEELVDFIGKARFDYVGVFAYSPEEGTVAAKSDGQLSDEVRLSRANELRAIADAIGFEQTARWIDTTLEVLLEDHLDTDQWQGRFPGQAPDIDGVVLVGVQPGVELESGMIVTTKIDDAYLYDLEGMISLE
ncbi:MAG: radical SAM protein, partial [Actinomycetia bacterium]|nr:radical SAM protein [Actinomycetes bacterium]